MRKSPSIRVFEYERLTLHKDEFGRSLTKSQLNKLYDFNDRNGNKYFTGIRDGIKFKSFVGVIQIGYLTIEILPKADRRTNKDLFEKETQDWQSALLRMLAITRNIKVDAVSSANLKQRYNSLLDLYFELYLNEIDALLRKGLIKQYINRSGNIKTLKGRIEFSNQIRQNVVHKERFYTAHKIYDEDHLINQILFRALMILEMLAGSQLKDRVQRLKLDFPEVATKHISNSDFVKLDFNRKTKHYQEALKIAKMLILNYSPDIKGGDEQMLALLFDMNKLWEEYVYRMLSAVKERDWNVSFQNSQKFWEGRMIRPDLVITEKVSKKVLGVIDTKWKVIGIKGPSDDDLKQMYAYNMYWDNRKSILLYPTNIDINERFGDFHKGMEGINQCKLGFIQVLNVDGTLNYQIGSVIISKLEITQSN